MDDAKKLEADLLCGVLDALPCPSALLDRGGHTVYVNSRDCPVDLDNFTARAREDVMGVLSSGEPFASRLPAEDGERAVWGLMELYPIHVNEQVIGVLLMFHPEGGQIPETLRDIRQASSADRISAMLASYGDSVDAKRRVADELGIGLSTLYRIMAREKRSCQ